MVTLQAGVTSTNTEIRLGLEAIHDIDINATQIAAATTSGIQIFDLTTLEQTHTLDIPHTGTDRVAWLDNGVLSGSYDGHLRLWSLDEIIWEHQLPAAVVSIATTDEYIAVSDESPALTIWDASTLQIIDQVTPRQTTPSLAWSPDGTTLAGGIHNFITRWSVDDGGATLIDDFNYAAFDIAELMWAPNGESMIVLGAQNFSGYAERWDIATGERIDLVSRGRQIWSAALSPDASQLVVGTQGGISIVPSANEDLYTSQRLSGLPGTYFDVFWLDDSRILGASDAGLTLWNPQPSEIVQQFALNEQLSVPIDLLQWSPDGERLAFVREQTIEIWDVPSLNRLHHFASHNDETVFSLAWSPDGERLASSGADERVRIWDIETGEELAALQFDTDRVRKMIWSGEWLVMQTGDSTLRVWNGIDLVARFELDLPSRLLDMAFTTDGQGLYAITNNQVTIYDTTSWQISEVLACDNLLNVTWTGNEPAELLRDPSQSSCDLPIIQVGSLFFDYVENDYARGHLALAMGNENTVVVWDGAAVIGTYFYRAPTSVEWSPDGCQLAISGYANFVRIITAGQCS